MAPKKAKKTKEEIEAERIAAEKAAKKAEAEAQKAEQERKKAEEKARKKREKEEKEAREGAEEEERKRLAEEVRRSRPGMHDTTWLLDRGLIGPWTATSCYPTSIGPISGKFETCRD